MHCVIGGAYAGKRSAVRARYDALVWHSAYNGAVLEDWRDNVVPGTTLVLEGWEQWLATALAGSGDDDRLRQRFTETLDALVLAERERGLRVVLILLEVGRGIVPIDARDRRLRDLAGWLAQDATARAGRVWYVWNGLVKQLA
ncbi:MAG: bifunctional adenosylcobinamide kinase/adenosylcobinamide-phosphate guanylyltransferase [Halomonas sp.]|nr:bifunctional adenosylcobinamide kinase/adenosylcobinamide-phosphate guanylyltransferase [Halomonas sp.]